MESDPDLVIPPDHPAPTGHVPGHPLVPGVLILDHVLAARAIARGTLRFERR